MRLPAVRKRRGRHVKCEVNTQRAHCTGARCLCQSDPDDSLVLSHVATSLFRQAGSIYPI